MRSALLFAVCSVGCTAPAVSPVGAPAIPSASAVAVEEPIVETDSPEVIARKFLLALSSADPAGVVARFDSTMQTALPAGEAIGLFKKLETQLGGYTREGGVRVEMQGGYKIVFLSMVFERGTLDMKVALDREGKIAGLFFVPPTPPYAAPSYADQTKLSEEDVVIGKEPFRLPGTLTIPHGMASKVPAVVLVHGSGPNDRDETLGPNKPLKDLALGLASRGIAVLRFDKRTRVHGKALAAEPTLTVEQESVEDALFALETLGADPRVDPDRLFVVGHSLGAYLGPRIAKRSPKLAGLVMLCSPARSIPTLMVEQLTYLASLDKSRSVDESRTLEEVKTARERIVEVVKAGAGKEGEMLLGAPPSYWIDLATYDPVDVAASLKLPVALFHGGRDYQVRDEDFAMFEKRLKSPQFLLKRFPNLNHLLQPGEGLSVPEEYAVRNEVAVEIVDAVASFIDKAQAKAVPR